MSRSSRSSPWPRAPSWRTCTTRSRCCTASPRLRDRPRADVVGGHGDADRLRGRAAPHRPAGRPPPAAHARRRSSAWLRSPWSLPPSPPACGSSPWPPWPSAALSVAGQVMIPFAADLAPEERRGRVVARIMTGLLLGILLARTVSGLVAQVGRLAGHLLALRRPHALFAVVLVAGAARRGAPPAPHVPPPGRLVAAAARRPSRSCAGGPGTAPGLRRLQRPVDPLAFLLSGPYDYSSARHRPLRSRRRRRDRGGQPGGQAGRLGPSPLTTVVAGLLLPASFALLGPADLAGRARSSASSCSTSAPRACRSPTRRSSTPSARRPQPDHQRVHGLLLHRRRHRLGRARLASTTRTGGPGCACSAPASGS